MPSAYLQSAEYATYGVPSATTAQVVQASALIDGFLKRPQGLVYVADAIGNPCYMAALVPGLTFTLQAGITAGASVSVAVNGAVNMLQVGDCVVLDRATPSVIEALQITSIVGNVVTFANVLNNHNVNAVLETGLLITEKRYLPKNRSEVVLAHFPVARVVGGTGRYGYGRRGDQAAYNMDNFNLLASLSKFGGPPAWEIWPANTSAGIDAWTGTLWVPAGIMLAYYSEIKVRYVSGFTYETLPSSVKQSCANIVQSISQYPEMNGNIKQYKAGDSQVERFADTVLDADTKEMLMMFKARLVA